MSDGCILLHFCGAGESRVWRLYPCFCFAGMSVSTVRRRGLNQKDLAIIQSFSFLFCVLNVWHGERVRHRAAGTDEVAAAVRYTSLDRFAGSSKGLVV